MKPPRTASRAGQGSTLWDLLTLEKLMTGSVVHLVYWCGLGIISLGGFGAIGAAVGVALREGSWQGPLLAIPTLVAGLLVMAVMAMLWRSFCELYVVIMRIGDDLNVLRRAAESQGVIPAEDVRSTRP